MELQTGMDVFPLFLPSQSLSLFLSFAVARAALVMHQWENGKQIKHKYHFALQCSTSEETDFCEPLVLLKYSVCCNDKCTAFMFPALLARDIVNQCFAFSYSITIKLGVTLV